MQARGRAGPIRSYDNPETPQEVRDFASVRPEDAEVGVHRVLQQRGLSCRVQVDEVNLGPQDELQKFPHIKFSSWLQYLTTKRITRQLCGASSIHKMKKMLKEFWERYKKINGDHEIFKMEHDGLVDLTCTIPFFSHSDEGRSYKKEALWIFSVHGCVGRGTRGYLNKQKHVAPLKRNQFGLNFVGHSLSNQFLFCTMLRETSGENPGALQKLLQIFATDAEKLCTEGIVTSEGHRLWFLHLGTKGDLPALSKVGGFTRAFSNIVRAPRSRKACGGICHRCLAGQESDPSRGMHDHPFEDLSRAPSWVATMDSIDPWNSLPDLLKGVPRNPARPSEFFCFDIWHTFHLGIAKHWLGSCLVLLVESGLPVLSEMRSVEARFGFITEKYREFCRSNKISMWVKHIDRDTLVWPQSSACPVGKWNKGSASTTLMLFLGYFGERYIKNQIDDEKLSLIVTKLTSFFVI